MTISYLYVGVLEQGEMQKGGFPKEGVRRVSNTHSMTCQLPFEVLLD